MGGAGGIRSTKARTELPDGTVSSSLQVLPHTRKGDGGMSWRADGGKRGLLKSKSLPTPAELSPGRTAEGKNKGAQVGEDGERRLEGASRRNWWDLQEHRMDTHS